MTDADRCVCCGEIVPEGRMVCPQCEYKAKESKNEKPKQNRGINNEALDSLREKFNYFRVYPYRFLDDYFDIKLNLFQRIFIRSIGLVKHKGGNDDRRG